jgi:hypothetical protein
MECTEGASRNLLKMKDYWISFFLAGGGEAPGWWI